MLTLSPSVRNQTNASSYFIDLRHVVSKVYQQNCKADSYRKSSDSARLFIPRCFIQGGVLAFLASQRQAGQARLPLPIAQHHCAAHYCVFTVNTHTHRHTPHPTPQPPPCSHTNTHRHTHTAPQLAESC